MKKFIKIITVAIFLLGVIPQVNAQDLYVFQNTKLKSNDGKTANVFLGVPVKVKKDLGKSVEVSILGYIDGNNVYSTKEKTLLIAQLNDGFKSFVKKENEIELKGTIEKELLTKNASEVWEEHQEFFFEMCTQCHAAPHVSQHSMVEWEALFAPMKGFAKLDEAESDYLLRYLQSNAANGLSPKH